MTVQSTKLGGLAVVCFSLEYSTLLESPTPPTRMDYRLGTFYLLRNPDLPRRSDRDSLFSVHGCVLEPNQNVSSCYGHSGYGLAFSLLDLSVGAELQGTEARMCCHQPRALFQMARRSLEIYRRHARPTVRQQIGLRVACQHSAP
ncbi:hypothetical protein BDV10DRAFT_155214 [Aspergillus recurvatus]